MTNPNAPAYPRPPAYYPANDPDFSPDLIGGLTKREEFAKAAMQGLLANEKIIESAATQSGEDVLLAVPMILAAMAVAHADALIVRLNKEKP